MPQFVDYVIIVSIAKPTTCTNFSNLLYFGILLYTFWTVFPSIIRSSRLYIQHHTIQVLWLLASKQVAVSVAVCSLELLMMDEKTVRNMWSVISK